MTSTALPEQTWVVIPARNEADSIATVLAALRTLGARVIVVDDASTDATRTVAEAAGAEVLTLAFRLGAWGAMQAGMRYCHARGAERVITLDADGQHEPAHIAELLTPLQAGQADVVIGSHPERVSRLRRLAWQYFRWLTRLDIHDLTSGFRAYNRPALEILVGRSATLLDYQDVGVLMLLRSRGLHITEVPVIMAPRQKGSSRVFSSWWVVFRYMLESTVLCIANVDYSSLSSRPVHTRKLKP